MGGLRQGGVHTVTLGGHNEILTGLFRKGQRCKLHQYGTGHFYKAASQIKGLEAPSLIGSLEALGREGRDSSSAVRNRSW